MFVAVTILVIMVYFLGIIKDSFPKPHNVRQWSLDAHMNKTGQGPKNKTLNEVILIPEPIKALNEKNRKLFSVLGNSSNNYTCK